jgi:hypothetical protein
VISRFETGELSYAKVRALVRIATPATEARLVETALHATASQLDDMVRTFKASERAALDDAIGRRARRSLRYRYDQDGSMVISVRLPPEDGALVLDVLEDIVRTDEAASRASAETPGDDPEVANHIERQPGERARADGLVGMARRAATTIDDEVIVTRDRPHLQVLVGADVCRLADGPALAVETACRMGCEGTMAVLVGDDEGNPLHLGDTTPVVNRRQKRALLARDRHCRFPGCTARHYLHAHHVVHWARGGRTCISNLLLLCSRHHHLVHEGGFTVKGANGKVVFTRPDERAIQEAPPTPPSHAGVLVAEHSRLGLHIDADTARSLSNGERYDKGLASDALWCLLHPEHILGPGSRRVPAFEAA